MSYVNVVVPVGSTDSVRLPRGSYVKLTDVPSSYAREVTRPSLSSVYSTDWPRRLIHSSTLPVGSYSQRSSEPSA